MLKELTALGGLDPEGFHIRGFLTNVGDHTNVGDQGIVIKAGMAGTFMVGHHFSSFPKALMTFTMFRWLGHLSTQRPQPTQENMPSLLAGK